MRSRAWKCPADSKVGSNSEGLRLLLLPPIVTVLDPGSTNTGPAQIAGLIWGTKTPLPPVPAGSPGTPPWQQGQWRLLTARAWGLGALGAAKGKPDTGRQCCQEHLAPRIWGEPEKGCGPTLAPLHSLGTPLCRASLLARFAHTSWSCQAFVSAARAFQCSVSQKLTERE